MTPAQLKASRPADYGPWDAGLFRRRIYQEIRRSKFVNWLNKKRADEQAKLI